MVVTYKVQINGSGVDVTQTVDNNEVPAGGGPDVNGPPPGAGNGQTYTLAAPPDSGHSDECGCGCETVVIFGPTVIRGGGGKTGAYQENDESMPDISFRALNFTLDKQVASKWCWAAVTASVRNFYSTAGTPRTLQCAVATETLSRATSLCSKAGKGTALAAGTFTEPAAVSQDDNLPEPLNLEKYGMLAAIKPNPFSNALSFAKVAAEIDAGRPVVVRIGWRPDGNNGHYIVISGYGRKNSVDYLYVQDPEGFSVFAPYAWVKSNYYLQNTTTGAASLGNWSWTYMLAPHSAAPVAIAPPSSLLGPVSGTGITVPVDMIGLADLADGKGLGFAHPGIPLTLASNSSPIFLTAGNRVAITGELMESAFKAFEAFDAEQPRYLRVPGLSLHALWTKKGKTTLIYPFEGFDSTILRQAGPIEELFQFLQPLANKLVRFDDRPSANQELRSVPAPTAPKVANTSVRRPATPRR